MKVKLQALKRQTYNTRHIEAGDVFDADKKFARVLIAQKRARAHDGGEPAPAAAQAPQEAPKDPPAVVEPQPTAHAAPDDLSDLRAEYERVVGKRPFNGWDAAELHERMAAHQAKGGDEGEGGGND
jgi:hypothetical protein